MMKKRYLSILLALSLAISMIAFSVPASAAETGSQEKQLYHLAVEDKAFGSYIYGDATQEGGVAFPDNSMATACGWEAVKDYNIQYNGGGWTASGVIVRVMGAAKITALGDIFQDATKLTGGLGDRGKSFAPHKVQLWKIAGVTDLEDNAQITNALANQENWTMTAEVTVTPDETTALGAGKGFNWTELETPVIVKAGELYVIVVEQGVGAEPGVSYGNPRQNELNYYLAMHPDNTEDAGPAQAGLFYIGGAPIGTFGGNLVDIQNAVAGSFYAGGNFKYEEIKPDEKAAPTASEITQNSAKLTWTKADNNDLGNVGGYIINRTNGENGETLKVNGADTLSFSDSGLTENTTYTYEIIAVDDVDAETPVVIAVYAAAEVKTLAAEKAPEDNQGEKEEEKTPDQKDDETVKTGVADNVTAAILLLVFAAGVVLAFKKKSYIK